MLAGALVVIVTLLHGWLTFPMCQALTGTC